MAKKSVLQNSMFAVLLSCLATGAISHVDSKSAGKEKRKKLFENVVNETSKKQAEREKESIEQFLDQFPLEVGIQKLLKIAESFLNLKILQLISSEERLRIIQKVRQVFLEKYPDQPEYCERYLRLVELYYETDKERIAEIISGEPFFESILRLSPGGELAIDV